MRSLLVIGLGRFGSSLAQRLSELGNEVLAIDRDPELVNKLASTVTVAQIGDCMDVEILRSLGVSNFDVCFVCISDDFQASLEIASNLKDLGAKKIVAKADREIHAKFLLKIGADEVVFPERDMARRTAVRFSAKGAFEYVELTPEYAIFELDVPKAWLGKSLREVDARSKHNINVIGVKNGEKIVPVTSPDMLFSESDHLIVAGSNEDLMAFINIK